jgi:DNA-binding GntR family transcriptional regulator
MAERWFSQEELRELSRPTMDRAIEALDRGDVEAARALCEQMRHEWRFMHDLLVDSLAGVFSFVKARQGEDAIEEMHRFTMERGWRRDVEAIARADRRHIVEALAVLPREVPNAADRWLVADG